MNAKHNFLKSKRTMVLLYLLFVLLTSFFTYFFKYNYPNAVFWDEPYHIAAAQKYLNGVHFMEQHPPLGKLLIALGEKITKSNQRNDQFIGTDYATGIDGNFSYTGYRLFPALLAWLTAPVLFFIFLFFTKNPALSALLSFLYIFDNAEIVHSRGAMVDSPLTFFGMLCVLVFLHLQQKQRNPIAFYALSALFGVCFALAVGTKLVGLIFVLFIPFLAWQLLETWRARRIFFGAAFGVLIVLPVLYHLFLKMLGGMVSIGFSLPLLGIYAILTSTNFQLIVGMMIVLCVSAGLWLTLPASRKVFSSFAVSLACFAFVFAAIWQIHFSLGDRVVPELNNGGYYQASGDYKKILTDKTNGSLSNFPVMMRDSLAYITFYNRGVPRLDLCKPDENGSPSYFWPFGARTINYRWEKLADGSFRYLYLQSNPVAWFLGFAGVVLAAFFLLSRVLLPQKTPLKHSYLLFVFFGMYASYMIAISQLGRVMYLYHYFVPLLFSFILFGLAFDTLETLGKWKLTDSRKSVIMTVLGLLLFAAFQFYRPLSYYEPIRDYAFRWRALLPVWELTCVDCEKTSGIVVPVQIDTR